MTAIIGMVTETLLTSPILMNCRTHWGPWNINYPCTVDHRQLLLCCAFVCLFSLPSYFSLFCGIRIPYCLPYFARPVARKKKLQKSSLSDLTTLFSGDSWVNLTRRLMVVNFPCTDLLSYLRTQLKAFVAGVCLRSRRFF